MGNISVTAAKVAVVYPTKAEIYDFIAHEDITAGQVVYMTTSGDVGLAASGTSAYAQPRGVALTPGAAGQAISVLKRGHCYGYTLDGVVSPDAILYLSATAGAMATTTSGSNAQVGRATVLPDNDLTDVAYIDCRWNETWS
jgi:hypothetical protein